MRYLAVNEVLEIHLKLAQHSGGGIGLRDLGSLESAVAQPRMTFAGRDLYPTAVEKASALCFSLINNHPFVDGNKRTAHAAMEVFLLLNGLEIIATIDEQEQVVLQLASGEKKREAFSEWLQAHVVSLLGRIE